MDRQVEGDRLFNGDDTAGSGNIAEAASAGLLNVPLVQRRHLSIAAEFSCGRDLTYLWSCSLPEDRVFVCPIPQWAPRETHVVVRSGAAGLGTWVSEERNLYADYEKILGRPPVRLVALWLIAVSLFQHGEGQADFASIAVEGGGRRIAVS